MSKPNHVDLSVIVPAYNAAAFIRPALESVLAQIPGDRSVEIVVADDGSTDSTVAQIASLADSRVECLSQENGGPASARNCALASARGQLLMLLDADDSLCPDCIETTLDFMHRYPHVGLFFTNYEIYDEAGVISPSGVDIWRRFRGLAHDEPISGEWIFTESLTPHIVEAGGFMHTSGLTFRRAVFERVGPFQEGYSYGEDDEFYARLAHVTTAGYVDRVLSRKRNHAGSLIHNEDNALRNMRHLLELSEFQLEYYAEQPGIRRVLHRKILDLVVEWCYLLVRMGRAPEARSRLREYRKRYPRSLSLCKLWLRSWWPVRTPIERP